MRMTLQKLQRLGVCVCLAAAIPTVGYGQQSAAADPNDSVGGPLTGPPVLNAPFSADATTTVQQTLGDGTRINRNATARYYRDRMGRIRVEQTIMGLEALNPAADRQVRITIDPEPGKGLVYTLDPATRKAIKGSRSLAGITVGGGGSFAVPLGGSQFLVFHRLESLRERYGLSANYMEDEELGTRPISGVEATGQRVTVTIPVGQFGNDRPMQLVDERWESPALKMVIYSLHSDPRTGIVEYWLTNIRRAEPAPELFVIPEDYTIGGSEWISLKYAEPPNGARGAPGVRRP